MSVSPHKSQMRANLQQLSNTPLSRKYSSSHGSPNNKVFSVAAVESIIFTDSYDLTNEGKKICDLLGIEPSLLLPRPIEGFAEKGVPDDLKRQRFEHYEERRKGKLKVISEFLRNKRSTPSTKGKSFIFSPPVHARTSQNESFHGRPKHTSNSPTQSTNNMNGSLVNIYDNAFEKEISRYQKWMKVKENQEKVTKQKLDIFTQKTMTQKRKEERLQKEKMKKEEERRKQLEEKQQMRTYKLQSVRHDQKNKLLESAKIEDQINKNQESVFEENKLKFQKKRTIDFIQNMSQYQDELSRQQTKEKIQKQENEEVEKKLKELEQKMQESQKQYERFEQEKIRKAAKVNDLLINAKESHQQHWDTKTQQWVNKISKKYVKAEQIQKKKENQNGEIKEKTKDFYFQQASLKKSLHEKKEKTHISKSKDIMKRHVTKHQTARENANKLTESNVQEKKNINLLRKDTQLNNLDKEKNMHRNFKQAVLHKHQIIGQKVENLKDRQKLLMSLRKKHSEDINQRGFGLRDVVDIVPHQIYARNIGISSPFARKTKSSKSSKKQLSQSLNAKGKRKNSLQ